MLFSVRHILRFCYARPVFVEPVTIRLCPRTDASQRILRHELKVVPEPAGMSQNVELDGNSVSHAWFNGMHESVTVTAVSEVETLRSNPFDFLLWPMEAAEVPMTYLEPHRTLLQAYLNRQSRSREVDEFAHRIFSKADGKTLPFLHELCQTIARNFEKVKRKSGEPMHPAQTLADRRGACRDLAVLFMDVCRAEGLAARFVSGYSGAVDREDHRELHAWAEVFLPGGGWRGYDPGQGVAVGDEHVAVAASPLALGTAPVHGTFRGTGVASSLEYEVTLSTSRNSSQYQEFLRAL